MFSELHSTHTGSSISHRVTSAFEVAGLQVIPKLRK
jgi:hypothetical protein